MPSTTTMTRRRAMTGGLLFAAAGLTACAGATPSPCPAQPVYPGQYNDFLIEDARKRLVEIGLTPTRIVVEPRRATRRRPLLGMPGEFEEDDRVVGYLVWADVAECPNGKVVLRYDNSCFVRSIYTRYDCSVEGLPAG
jgi:hypothetical protein